jgi:hypothetical protein
MGVSRVTLVRQLYFHVVCIIDSGNAISPSSQGCQYLCPVDLLQPLPFLAE